jgi:hypothetical protein
VGQGFWRKEKILSNRKNFCFGQWLAFFSEKKFGNLKSVPLHLLQFFQNHLSRKAEGYGPMKPWQPYRNTRPVEGANSILHGCASGLAERDKSEIKFDITSY